MAAKQAPPQPPRLTNDPAKDASSMRQWFNAFFQNTVKENGLLDPNKQFVPDTFDPENLPAATDSTIANAQQTANEAYKIAAGSTTATDLATETAARQAADATLTTNLAAETTARQAADTTLTTNLAAETTARQGADTTLTANVATNSASIATLQSQVPLWWGQSSFGPAVTSQLTSYGVTLPTAPSGYAAMVQVRSCTGTPVTASLIPVLLTITSTGITITLGAAPGAGNTVTFDVAIYAKF